MISRQFFVIFKFSSSISYETVKNRRDERQKNMVLRQYLFILIKLLEIQKYIFASTKTNISEHLSIFHKLYFFFDRTLITLQDRFEICTCNAITPGILLDIYLQPGFDKSVLIGVQTCVRSLGLWRTQLYAFIFRSHSGQYCKIDPRVLRTGKWYM